VTGGLELQRPRDLSTLFGDALRVYFRHLLTFWLQAAAIVVPVHLIVSGVGLEQLTAGYDDSPSPVELVIPALVSYLVVSPLITATCIYSLREVAAGNRPPPGRSIAAGFEAFAPIFGAVVLAALGITVGLLLIVPGVYLFVRWFFVPQEVVVEGVSGIEALKRSGQVVQGFWWRTLGIIVLGNVAVDGPAILLSSPFVAAADGSDRAVFTLVGSIVTDIITAPFIALLATLLYFDLRARRAGAAP